MENLNEKSQTTQGVIPDKLKKMLDDYENPAKNKPVKLSKEELLRKFFVPRNRTETFRILPPLENREYIETAYFHVVNLNSPTGKRYNKKIYCPAHNDKLQPKKNAQGDIIKDMEGKPVMVMSYCPLCEKYKKKLAEQDNSVKGIKRESMNPQQLAVKKKNDEIYKEAIQWQAKEFHIVRGIDKGSDKDGVKFWRFKHNYKKQGVQDKLLPVLSSYVDQFGLDPTDPQKGCDLIITVVDAQMAGRTLTYKDVSSITSRNGTKLHEDPIVVKLWLNDKIIWREVFRPPTAPNLETVEYLERVSRGVDPYWDDTDPTKKHWVFPDPKDAELQKRANTRDMNLDGTRPERMQLASDLAMENNKETYVKPPIDKNEKSESSITETADVFEKDVNSVSNEPGVDSTIVEDYDDLPF